MDDGERLQLAQQIELVRAVESSAELEGMNWVYV